MSDCYLGEIRLFGGDFAPKGWRYCDGSLLSINDFSNLFGLIGTTFGGDGMNNFALPNLTGRVAIGTGQGKGLSQYDVGDTGGQNSVELGENHGPVHSHDIMASTKPGTSLDPSNAVFAMPPAPAVAYLSNSAAGNLVPLAPESVYHSDGAGEDAGAAHDNVMPTLVMNYIIAVEDAYFPSPN